MTVACEGICGADAVIGWKSGFTNSNTGKSLAGKAAHGNLSFFVHNKFRQRLQKDRNALTNGLQSSANFAPTSNLNELKKDL
jgi:hypothetical protein